MYIDNIRPDVTLLDSKKYLEGGMVETRLDYSIFLTRYLGGKIGELIKDFELICSVRTSNKDEIATIKSFHNRIRLNKSQRLKVTIEVMDDEEVI